MTPWENGNELIRHGGPWDRGSADSYYSVLILTTILVVSITSLK